MSSNAITQRDPVFGNLHIPYICRHEDFCSVDVSFVDIPEHFEHRLDMIHIPEYTPLDEHSVGTFLQGWLFFSLLSKTSSVFGVTFQGRDFVLDDADGSPRLTCHALAKYCWFWRAATNSLHGEDTIQCLRDVKAFLDVLHRVTSAWVTQKHVPITASLEANLFSLMLLADALLFALPTVLGFSEVLHTELYAWSYPHFLTEALLKAGWCRGELKVLFRTCGPSMLLYLTSVDRRRPGKSHSNCTDHGCVTNQLDESTYQSTHAPDCHVESCDLLPAPTQQIRKILKDGGIPIVRLSAANSAAIGTIEVRSFSLNAGGESPDYVAISHVWSDGMGNPRANELPACQVHRIQLHVDALLSSDSTIADSIAHGHTWFWMDTLCVPLDRDTRRLAIIRMAKTYLHAQKVLVIDNWLCQHTGYDVTTELIVKIAYSDWNTRLWTLQESILAKERYFQCADRAFVVTALNNGTNLNGLEEVSAILETLPMQEIMENPNAQALIRALISYDDSAEKLIQHYAENNTNEELRESALEARKLAVQDERLRAIWLSRTEDWHLVSPDPDLDDTLKKSISVTIPILDPITCQAGLVLQRSRGVFYQERVDRPSDLVKGLSRQLAAFKDRPSSLLQDVAAGLPGRTTSKVEDETICLGGMIGLEIERLLGGLPSGSSNRIQVANVNHQRMMDFLYIVQEFPASILFWESDRLPYESWRWAPASFLDRKACRHMLSSKKSRIISEGLLCEHLGVRLFSSGFVCPINEHDILRLQGAHPSRLDPQSALYNFFTSWETIKLRLSDIGYRPEGSWATYLDPKLADVAIILAEMPGLEGILVRLSQQKDNITYARYLANVVRVSGDDIPKEQGMFIKAESMGTRTWCIG